jgi:hypothetical protein
MKHITLLFSLLLLLTFASTTNAYNFTEDLELGSRGSDVINLQEMLVSGGYLQGDSITGYFGLNTESALKQWQTENHIQPISGFFGPKSRQVALKYTTPSTAGSVLGVFDTITPNSFTSSHIALINDSFVRKDIFPENIVSKSLAGLTTLNKAEALSLIESLKSKRILSRTDYTTIKNDLNAGIVPTANLKINNVSDLTINPGQAYTYTWSSTNGSKFSAKWETATGQSSKCGGMRGTTNFIDTASGSKNGIVPILSSHAGCVWDITFTVESANGEKAESVAKLRVPAAAAAATPTASLLVNNSSNVTNNPGDRYVYSWSSTNGATASGRWTSNNATRCAAASGIMRNMNTLSGSYTATETISSAHAGCVWTVVYEVENRDGVKASSTVTITVPAAATTAAAPAPTASLKISNQSDLTVRPGGSYNYSWTSTNGVSARGTWRTTAGDTAKCGTSGTMIGMNTLIGSINQVTPITSNHAGCVWETKYEVENRDGVKTTSTAILRASL